MDGGGRSWQRASSKNARGNSQNRFLQQPSDQLDLDPMMSTVQKSHIASILQGARSTVGAGNEMSRPYTPGDLPRHLFSGDDYSNRPGSSYKMKNIVGQAIDEFNSAVGNQTISQNTTTSSGNIGGGMQMIQNNKLKMRSDSQSNNEQNIINVLQKHGMDKKTRGNFLPSLQPISKDSIKNLGQNSRQQIKGFDSTKPVKVQVMGSGSENMGSDISISGTGIGTSKNENLNSSVLSGSVSSNLNQSNTGTGVSTKTVVKLKRNTPAQVPDLQEGNQGQLPPKQLSSKQTITQQRIKKQKSTTDDYSDLMQNNEDYRMEEQQKFDQSKMDNLIKMQQIQQQIKQANRNRDDLDGEGEDEDQYENYFESQMQLDMKGVEEYEKPVDYGQALQKIQSKVKDIDQSKSTAAGQQNDIDEFEEEYMAHNIEEDQQTNGYVVEYFEVVNEMSRYCTIISQNQKLDSKEKKQQINEEEIIELCPRIYTLATEHENQMQSVQLQCFLETLLKGSFSLLSVKHSRAVLRLSACNIHLFLKIFDRYCQNLNHGTQADFKKLYNYLFETMKVLLVYAKEKKNDILFKSEGLIPQLSRVLHQCYLDRADVIIKLTSHVVNKKEILNEDLIYDLVNYIIGSIKCFSQTSTEVQQESVKQRYIMLLSKCMQKAINFGTNMSKKAQNLVQICGALRNLANEEGSFEQFQSNGIIVKLVDILEKFKGHQELMINVSRILSKVSMDTDCSYALIKTQKLPYLIDMLFDYHQIRDLPVRISFVLANLTTYFEEAREQIGSYQHSLSKILQIGLTYFEKEEVLVRDGEKMIEDVKNPNAPPRLDPINNFANIEDNLIKLIRLVANLITDESFTTKHLKNQQSKLNQFMEKMIASVKRKSIQKNEEFIFNAVSCSTNIMFYDVPHSQLLSHELRVSMFNTLKSFILITQNEELQVEAVRVLSNLSRHPNLCLEFVSDKTFLEALTVVLDHTLRDLVFYAIGIVINITLHEATRPKVLEQGVIGKLIDVLRDANIEDMELAKVSAKALHNLASESSYWTIDNISKLDQILTSLGEELDSIMDVANEEEMEEIKSLRDMVNALINDMPEPMFNCPDHACGRKFKNRDELDKHVERRHGGKIPNQQ